MLVITRKPMVCDAKLATLITRGFTRADMVARTGHGFWIGPDIHVLLLEYDQGAVRLGINAPRSVIVRRDELAPW